MTLHLRRALSARQRFGSFYALCALGVALALAPGAAAQNYSARVVSEQDNQNYSYARVVRLSLVDGNVLVLRPEAENWEEALLNLPIRQGYTISTSNGRAEIEFESGATARIAEDTALEFTELALADGNRITRMKLQRGTATFYANSGRRDVFVVTTPDLELDVPGNARFRTDVLSSGTTVTMLKGEIEARSSEGSYRLTKGQTLVFQQAASEQARITRNREQDEWDRWVADREDSTNTASANSLRYVNAPFRYGIADLSSHGGWFYDASYGNVWQPWGLASGWSPYWQGRWVFINGVGWTWVSVEPWGWVPYHYGRWVLTHRGWVWIPGGFHSWHPGLVSWFHFGNQVGWCALGPRDRLGVAPRHPQGGVVVVNTPTGVIGGTHNDHTNLGSDVRPHWVMQAPLATRPNRPVLDGDPEVHRGKTPATATIGSPTPGQPAGGQPAGVRSPTAGENPGIVYDRDEHRYVNNPRTPQRPATEGRPDTAVMGRPTTPSKPGVAPREAPPDRANPGPREGWSSNSPRPSTSTPDAPRSQPQLRTESQRPAPQPRAESPRPSPPPRTESPRPAPSAPRTESPRPSPSGGASTGSAPRPAPAPSSPPRPQRPHD